MSAFDEVEERAARFVMRREESDWSDEDQIALDKWLAESMAHKAAYWRLSDGWAAAGRIAAVAAGNNQYAETKTSGSWRWGIAASLLLLIVGGPAMDRRQTARAAASYRTNIGGHEIVPLADGSRIELNTTTTVRAAVDNDRREVWLDQGEAYFEVKHDASRPFIVHAGLRKVTVLGTKFSVRRDRGKIVVAVVDGLVRVDGNGNGPSRVAQTIARGGVAIAEGQATLVVVKSPDRMKDGLSWRDGMLIFDQATIADAAAEFNRYNRRKLVIADPAVAAIRIGGSFQTSNVDAFVSLLQLAYGVKSEVRGDEVKIYG